MTKSGPAIHYLYYFWYTHIPNFISLSWFWKFKEHPCPSNPHLGLWRTLDVPDWGFASWYWFGYGHWSLVHHCLEVYLSIIILKVQRTAMSFKFLFRALEYAGGFWPRLKHFILDLDIGLWYIHVKFWLAILSLKLQRTSMSFKSLFWALKDTGGTWLGFDTLSWFRYGPWSLIHPWLSIWILKVH